MGCFQSSPTELELQSGPTGSIFINEKQPDNYKPIEINTNTGASLTMPLITPVFGNKNFKFDDLEPPKQ